jgi:hypothetical protein
MPRLNPPRAPRDDPDGDSFNYLCFHDAEIGSWNEEIKTHVYAPSRVIAG